MLRILSFVLLLSACGAADPDSALHASREARYLLQAPAELSSGFWAGTQSSTLAQDFVEQRRLGWSLWTELMKPAGRFLVWQTWYSREDLQRIFQQLYTALGPIARRQRQSFTASNIDSSLRWNDADQFQSSSWDQNRFNAWIAAYDTDEKMRAVPGMQKILFNRIALVFILESYAILEKCQKDRSQCQGLHWPEQAIFLKTSWRRSGDGFHVERFPGDAASLAEQWQKPQWTADATLDPDDAAAFALRLPTGQKFHLVGLHASVRIQNHWFWSSLWMDPSYTPDEMSRLPGTYRLCAVDGWNQPLATQAIGVEWPTAVAAQAQLQKAEQAFNWCSNPYLEPGPNNQKTNCIGCHQHAGSNWTQQEFTRRLTQDLPSLLQKAPAAGPADFVWSVFAGPEALILPLMDSIEYFDVYDPYQSL